MKTAGQILVDTAEQTLTPALVTHYKGIKKMFVVVYCYLSSVYAKLTLHVLMFTNNIRLCITPEKKQSCVGIIGMIMSALRKVHKQACCCCSLLVTKRQQQNTWLLLVFKLN